MNRTSKLNSGTEVGNEYVDTAQMDMEHGVTVVVDLLTLVLANISSLSTPS